MDTLIDNKQLWENTLLEIEMTISKANFTTWFKDTYIVKREGGVIFVGVPNQFTKEWLVNKHHKFILKTLRSFLDEVRSVDFIVSKNKVAEEKVETQQPTFGGELPLKEYYVNRSSNLNPRYVFDTFIVGQFNEFAYAASQAVVNEPGITYNPLFIYGETGFGKTHLIQSMGNQLKKRNPNRKVFYVTSEKFANDYVSALQNKTISVFKDKYRQYDIFIMDDIQFLSKKEKIQEELFHLFNTLYDNNKQIIFSSDKHPNQIPDIADRLKSRFAQGMIVDISEPDHDSRVAILRSKSQASNFNIPDDVVDFLASSVQGSIRDLEGVLNAVMCQSQLKGVIPPINDLKTLIKESMRPRKTLSVEEVVKQASGFFNIDEELIYAKTRKKEIVRPRQLIMYILREDLHMSYPTIGQKLGGRDHTTVIHSYEKIKNNIKEDLQLKEDLDHIRTLLK